MNSIHTFARKTDPKSETNRSITPPVILVGTKKDKLPTGKFSNVEEVAKKRLDGIVEYLSKHVTTAVNSHLVKSIAVDNTSSEDPGIELLRQTIREEAKKHFCLGEIPVQWLQLELSLRKRDENMMELSEAYKEGKKLKLEESQVDDALAFYHDVGEILHFKTIPELSDKVILKMGWLVNLFKTIITPDPFKKTSPMPIINHRYKELLTNGRLYMNVVEHVLKANNREDDKTILLELFEKFDIICKAPGEVPADFYMPHLLQGKQEIESKTLYNASLHIHFIGNFLPDGLFYRLVVRCVRRWCDLISIFKHHAEILKKSNRGLLQVHLIKQGTDIVIGVTPAASNPGLQLQPSMLIAIREDVMEELGEITYSYCATIQYYLAKKCECGNHNGEFLEGAEDVDDGCAKICSLGSDVYMVCVKKRNVLDPLNIKSWFIDASTTKNSDRTIEDDLETVRKNVSIGEIKFLARTLGMTDTDLSDIEHDHRYAKECKYQILKKWRENQTGGYRAIRDRLMKALREEDLNLVADMLELKCS